LHGVKGDFGAPPPYTNATVLFSKKMKNRYLSYSLIKYIIEKRNLLLIEGNSSP
jgi:hypothetical protein